MSAPPGEKDVLFGRGRTVFQHLGNKTFRKFIDLHIEDYISCEKRQDKSGMVRDIVHDFYEAGYRFMKPNEERMFVEIDRSHALGKVGHALRDRSPLLDKIRNEPQKTRHELQAEGISVLRYAELLIRGKIPPLRRKRTASISEVANTLATASDASIAAAAARLHAATTVSTAGTTIDITNDTNDSDSQDLVGGASLPLPPINARKNEKRRRSSTNAPQPNSQQFINNGRRRKKTINEIVVPAMKNGNLPYGGYWKFFPLPEVQDSVDLGHTTGWKLKLVPISFAAKPIILDVL